MERKEILKGLNHLIELDRGTAAAYTEAIEKLRDENDMSSSDQLSTFKEDHLRHLR